MMGRKKNYYDRDVDLFDTDRWNHGEALTRSEDGWYRRRWTQKGIAATRSYFAGCLTAQAL
jgi:hypothetical protein